MSLLWVILYILTSLKTCAKQLLQHDERICFTGKPMSVPFATSEHSLQWYLPLTLCTKLTVTSRVTDCRLSPLPWCL